MARVNTPPTYACGHCGSFGHNKRTCAALAAGQAATPLVPAKRPVPSRFDILISKITALVAEANGLGVRQVMFTTIAFDNSTSDPSAPLAAPDDAGVASDDAATVADDTQDTQDATIADDVARILAEIGASDDVPAALDAALPATPAAAEDTQVSAPATRKGKRKVA